MTQNQPHSPDLHADWKLLTVRGLRWIFTTGVLKQLLNFGIGICLARLLDPGDFGLVGMVLVFTGFAGMFIGKEFGAAIIQNKNLTQRHYDSIFWLNVFLGALCTAALCFAGPAISRFYNTPDLTPITMLISVNFFVGCLNVVQVALLDKTMNFRRLAIIETVSIVSAGAVGIALAASGRGVWSLVWQSITLSLLTVILTWSVSRWRPGFRFDPSAIRDVLRFSVYLLGFNAVNFFARNFDNLLIGKYLGFYPLGIYGKAYQLMMFPLAQISWGVARVMFPSMSAIQHDRGKVKNVYLKCLRAIALITFPLMAGLFVVSGPFVSAFFGEKWAPMVPVIRIFCLAGLLDSVTTTVGLIYQSQGRTDVQFKMILVQIVIILSAFVIGLSWGITGVAAGYLAAALIILYPVWKVAGRLIDLTFGEMARNLSGTFLCAAGMAAAVWVFGMMLPYGWASWMRLAAEVFFGVGAYAALVRIFRLKGYREAGEIVSSLYRKAS